MGLPSLAGSGHVNLAHLPHLPSPFSPGESPTASVCGSDAFPFDHGPLPGGSPTAAAGVNSGFHAISSRGAEPLSSQFSKPARQFTWVAEDGLGIYYYDEQGDVATEAIRKNVIVYRPPDSCAQRCPSNVTQLGCLHGSGAKKCDALTLLRAELGPEPFATTSAAARRGGGVGVGGMTLASISESFTRGGGALVCLRAPVPSSCAAAPSTRTAVLCILEFMGSREASEHDQSSWSGVYLQTCL